MITKQEAVELRKNNPKRWIALNKANYDTYEENHGKIKLIEIKDKNPNSLRNYDRP